MKPKYMYLFPFEKVPKNANILIYGAGDVGQEYLKQIKISGYCNIIGFVDKAYDKFKSLIVPVYSLDAIGNMQFDYIVIAMKTGIYVNDIIRK